MSAIAKSLSKACILAAVAMLCVCACPISEAAVNRPFDVSCSIVPEQLVAVGRADVGGGVGGSMSGMTWTQIAVGISSGNIPFDQVAFGISNMTIASVSSLMIYDESKDDVYSYSNVDVFLENGSAVLGLDHTLPVSGQSEGAIIYMEDNYTNEEGKIVCAIAGSGGEINISGNVNAGYFYPFGGRMTIIERGSSTPDIDRFNTSKNYYCAFSGNVQISESASAFMLPAQDLSVALSASDSPLNISEIIGFVSDAMGGGGEMPDLLAMPPIEIFNGAIVGPLNGTAYVEGEPQNISGSMNVLRFESAEFTMSEDMVKVDGKCKFAMLGGAVYDKTAGIDIYGFTLPMLAIYIWIGAVAAIILSIFLAPVLSKAIGGASRGNAQKSGQGGKSEIKSDLNDILKLPALLIHIALAILAFWLFDREFKYILGVSLFESIGNLSGGINFTDIGSMISLAFAIFVPVSWFLVSILFGLPTKVIASSAFRVFGFAKGARGISKAIGHIVGTYLIGSTMILWSLSFMFPLVLNLGMGGLGGAIPGIGG